MKKHDGIYLVNLEHWSWDEYKGFVVIAEDRKHLWKLLHTEYPMDIHAEVSEDNAKVTKIGDATYIPKLKTRIILASFNAG